jgi:hypothetical protein
MPRDYSSEAENKEINRMTPAERAEAFKPPPPPTAEERARNEEVSEAVKGAVIPGYDLGKAIAQGDRKAIAMELAFLTPWGRIAKIAKLAKVLNRLRKAKTACSAVRKGKKAFTRGKKLRHGAKAKAKPHGAKTPKGKGKPKRSYKGKKFIRRKAPSTRKEAPFMGGRGGVHHRPDDFTVGRAPQPQHIIQPKGGTGPKAPGGGSAAPGPAEPRYSPDSLNIKKGEPTSFELPPDQRAAENLQKHDHEEHDLQVADTNRMNQQHSDEVNRIRLGQDNSRNPAMEEVSPDDDLVTRYYKRKAQQGG